MKFFFQLGDPPNNPTQPRTLFPTNLYGPFDSDRELSAAMFRARRSDVDQQFLIIEGRISGVAASPLDRPAAERREPGDFNNFVASGDWYDCRDCQMPTLHSSIQDHSRGEDGPITWFPSCKFCDKSAAQMGDQPVQIKHSP